MRFRWSRVARACLAVMVGVMMLATTTGAEAARRAFIVGNANYLHTTALANPANDARDLATRLRELGWEVTVQFDASRSALLKGFASFASSLKPDDLSLVYFAGHALQIGGENYLAPVDAQAKSEDDVRRQFVSLNAFLADLSRLTKTRIVILDACRDNPLVEGLSRGAGTRSVGAAKGLARVYAGVGSFIVYSTQPGNVALDGSGRNSPFTKALLDHMSLAGADVHAVMRRVRADVQQDTREQQIPWENSSLIDEVAFASGGPSPIATLPPSVAAIAAVGNSTADGKSAFHKPTNCDARQPGTPRRPGRELPLRHRARSERRQFSRASHWAAAERRAHRDDGAGHAAARAGKPRRLAARRTHRRHERVGAQQVDRVLPHSGTAPVGNNDGSNAATARHPRRRDVM